MPLRHKIDGLVHAIASREWTGDFGRLRCGKAYSHDPVFARAYADYTRAQLTCLVCIAVELRRRSS